MNSENRVHTYGDSISSREYENAVRRREWIKRNKGRLILVFAVVAIGAIATVMTLMLI